MNISGRLRIGFAITTILGLIYLAAGLFDSLIHVAIGLTITSLGVLGYGCIDYTTARHDDRLYQTRVDVWERRDRENNR